VNAETDPALGSAIDTFLDYLRFEKEYSENTLAAYQRDLTRFAATLNKSPEAVTRNDINAFVARLHGQGLAPRSIQRALSSVRSFFPRIKTSCHTLSTPIRPLVFSTSKPRRHD
jgi:site-specific recombinase XerD